MKLREYLKLKSISQQEFADRIGVTRPLVTLIVNGKKNPSINVVVRIEEETQGLVKLSDLFNPEAPSRLKKKKKVEKNKK